MQLSATMNAIIDLAYQVFSRYPVPPQFNFCTCCCLYRDVEQALHQTPVRMLPFKVMHVYNQNEESQEQDVAEVRYLLPRLLELIAGGQYPGMSEELSLWRVGRAHPENWPPAEQEVLAAFARQLIVDLLLDAESAAQLADLEVVLIMCHLGGLDITPLLDVCLEQPGFWAIASLAFLLGMERSEGKMTNAFTLRLEDDLLNQRINHWVELKRGLLSERAAQAIVSSPDPSPEYMRYFYGTTLGYWIEESLCAAHDGLL